VAWELIEESDWHMHEDAQRAIFAYLAVWYDQQRRYSALGYKSPAASSRCGER